MSKILKGHETQERSDAARSVFPLETKLWVQNRGPRTLPDGSLEHTPEELRPSISLPNQHAEYRVRIILLPDLED